MADVGDPAIREAIQLVRVSHATVLSSTCLVLVATPTVFAPSLTVSRSMRT